VTQPGAGASGGESHCSQPHAVMDQYLILRANNMSSYTPYTNCNQTHSSANPNGPAHIEKYISLKITTIEIVQ